MEDDRELLENLRALAADGPQGAPDRVEWRLRAEFRARNRRRRARQWVSIAGIAALAAGLALFAVVRENTKSRPLPQARLVAAAADSSDDSDVNFYPLPEAEGLPAAESAVVVQVQLPASSLRLMGVPVEEQGDGAVQAELLLGQDGLARGVRLVQ